MAFVVKLIGKKIVFDHQNQQKIAKQPKTVLKKPHTVLKIDAL